MQTMLLPKLEKNAGLLNKGNLMIPLIIVCVFMSFAIYVYHFQIDDSFISQRYAENLANFGALSYNAGESPQEGYSNFLLVLIEALFVKFGVSGSIVVAKVTGITSAVLTLFVTLKLTESMPWYGNNRFKYLPALALAVSTPFVAWAVGGLETLLFTLLIVTGALFSVKEKDADKFYFSALIDAIFLLSVLCRMEGLMFWGISVFYRLSNGSNVHKRRVLYSGLISATLFAGYLMWKVSYFGGVLPLTFYAKASTFNAASLTGGITKFWFFLKINLNFIYFGGLLVSVYKAVKSRNKDVIYILALMTSFLFYVFSQGRFITMDHIFRFYVPALPFFYILGTAGIVSLIDSIRFERYVGFVTVVLVLLMTAQIGVGFKDLKFAWDTDLNFGSSDVYIKLYGMKQLVDEGEKSFKDVAYRLAKIAPPGSTMVLADVGVIPYYSKLNVIDVWSLVTKDLVMMHYDYVKTPDLMYSRKVEITTQMLDYVFERKPEFIIQTGGLPIEKDSRIKDYTELPNLKYTYLGEPRYLLCRKDLLPSISQK